MAEGLVAVFEATLGIGTVGCWMLNDRLLDDDDDGAGRVSGGAVERRIGPAEESFQNHGCSGLEGLAGGYTSQDLVLGEVIESDKEICLFATAGIQYAYSLIP